MGEVVWHVRRPRNSPRPSTCGEINTEIDPQGHVEAIVALEVACWPATMSLNCSLAGANATDGDAAAGTTSDAMSTAISIVLCIAGAASLAYSMAVQRMGLASEGRTVKIGCCNVHWFLVYFSGLCGYGVANGFKVTAFNLGPFSVLGSVFSLVLVFNLIFARCLLKETITWPKIASSVTILLGAVLCAIGAPTVVQTVFTPSDVSALFATHVPFVALLSTIMCLAVVGIVWFEYSFPVLRCCGAPPAEAAADGASAAAVKAEPRRPPPRLDWLMALVYPGALGFDEALADVTIRAWTAMLGTCTGGVCDLGTGLAAVCDVPIVYCCIGFWVLLSFGGSLIWMPVVYARYEVSVALPIEYGALNACTVLSGLLFYDEHEAMAGWQLAMQILGTCVIFLGIGVGRIPPRGDDAASARGEGDKA